MKLRYLLDPSSQITVDFLGRVINDFSTRHLQRLNKLDNYYRGKQLITYRKPTDIGKPCAKVVVNYCHSITQNYAGYLTGIPIIYSNDDFQDVLDIIKYNDSPAEDAEYLKNALIFGRAFECNYIDEDGKQRFKLFNTKECIPVYSNSLNGELLYVIRFYREDYFTELNKETYIVEVYGPNSVVKYRSVPGFTSFNFIEERQHFFNQCPVTVFSLNEDEDSIFEQVISLQDAYNQLLASGVDDIQAWADAYLVLKGVTADSDDLDAMKVHRVLMIDNDADATYLTKDSNNAQLQYLLNKIDEQIHYVSNSPNMLDEKFFAQSGIAIRYKLVGMETAASNIENNMKKALQRRIELICSILALTDVEETWRDVDIKFTRNLPNDLSDLADTINKYRGLVSTKTLLSQIPFVTNVDEELERIRQEQEEELSLIEFNHEIETSEGPAEIAG